MTLRLLPVLSVTASLVSTAFGVDFATCKDSSCPAWKAFVDDSEKDVYIKEQAREEAATSKDSNQDKPQLYRIEIKSGETSFTKLHRYSEFDTLKDKLGDVAASLSQFPPKVVFKKMSEMLWPGTLKERRTQLEAWLQKILAHDDSKGPWADALFLFLDPVNSVTIAKAGMSMPLGAHKICNDNAYFFGIDVETNKGRVWRRYNDFHKFHATLEKMGGMGTYGLGVPFPSKIWWKSDDELEERRRGLEVWLAHVKTHANSNSGGIWEKEVNKFLDPAGNQDTLGLMCRLGDAAREHMEKWYTQIKDGVKSYMEEL